MVIFDSNHSNMKKILLASTLCLGLFTASKATVHLITISGTTFTPATVTASVGDTVAWALTGVHTATEVSSATWAANGNTPFAGGPGGGFNYNQSNTLAGTSWIKITSTSTIYFVCSPHAAMSMKGQINVSGTTGINEQAKELSFLVYPNPATNYINVNVSGSDDNTATIEVINLLGSKVIDLGGKQTLVNGVKRIDVSALPKGVYFVNIVADNKNRSIRFVKE
jgi:plastocyanin